jgi:hypothetical protein
VPHICTVESLQAPAYTAVRKKTNHCCIKDYRKSQPLILCPALSGLCALICEIIFVTARETVFLSYITKTPALPYICSSLHNMNSITPALKELFGKVPRRHSKENVQEINSIVTDYEDILKQVESTNAFYEEHSAKFFDELDEIRSKIKMSNDNKASKKNKDVFFDEASGLLKDSIEGLVELYGDGSRND